MAPVLILQFMADDAPAYLGTWLRRRGIDADVRLAEGGPAFPDRVDGYRALALLGGSMSVNDELRLLAHRRAADRAGDGPKRPGAGPLPRRSTDGARARRQGRCIAGAGDRLAAHRMRRSSANDASGSAPSPRSTCSTGITRPSICPPALSAWPPALRAPIRRLPSARIWPCSSMSRSTTRRYAFGCRRAKPPTRRAAPPWQRARASSGCATTPRCISARSSDWPIASMSAGGACPRSFHDAANGFRITGAIWPSVGECSSMMKAVTPTIR